MKKLAAVLAAAALAFFGLVATGTAAEAYPQQTFALHVNATVVRGGQPVVANARSSNPCLWSATFARQSRHASGKAFTARFTAPRVTTPTTFPLTVSCDKVIPSGGGASVAVRSAVAASKTVDIKVLPRVVGNQGAGQAASGALPNTGGPSAGLLAGGAVLVLCGGAAIAVSVRRRRSAA